MGGDQRKLPTPPPPPPGAINDHKLIVIIVKSVDIHIHFILYRNSFLSAYPQLGMLGTIFAMVLIVALLQQ